MRIGRRKESRISLRWPIHIINPVNKTKLSCNTPTDEAPQFVYKLDENKSDKHFAVVRFY